MIAFSASARSSPGKILIPFSISPLANKLRLAVNINLVPFGETNIFLVLPSNTNFELGAFSTGAVSPITKASSSSSTGAVFVAAVLTPPGTTLLGTVLTTSVIVKLSAASLSVKYTPSLLVSSGDSKAIMSVNKGISSAVLPSSDNK